MVIPVSSNLTEIKNTLKSIAGGVSDEVKDYFAAGLGEYIEDRKNKFSYTNTFLFPDKIDFYEIYFPLTLRLNDKNLEPSHLPLGLFEKSNTAGIIGTAGSGKTMIMKHVFLQFYRTLDKIPIFIELRDFNKTNLSFRDFIYATIISNRIKPSTRILENALKSGQFVFLLDGYDELSLGRKDDLTRQFEEFIDLNHKNWFLFSSRPGTNLERFTRLSAFAVQQLKQTEIEQFIDKQLKHLGDPELIEKLKTTISAQENHSYLGYVANPLLLSMFILTYRNYPELPKAKSKFYWNVFDTLCTKHDSISKRGAYLHERKTKLQTQDFEAILKAFCYMTLMENQFVFDRQYLHEKFNIVRKRLEMSFDIEDLIYDLTVAIPILIIDGIYCSFPHRTMQDYFTAAFIKDQSDESKKRIYSEKIGSIVRRRFENNRTLYELFSEMDKEAFYEYFILPILESFEEKFGNPNDHLFLANFVRAFQIVWSYEAETDTIRAISMTLAYPISDMIQIFDYPFGDYIHNIFGTLIKSTPEILTFISNHDTRDSANMGLLDEYKDSSEPILAAQILNDKDLLHFLDITKFNRLFTKWIDKFYDIKSKAAQELATLKNNKIALWDF